MTIREIEIFLYLCKTSSISKSAKLAGISQSAASLAIKSLEKDLEELLFDRLGKKLAINERGREFKSLVEAHFHGIQQAKENFKSHTLKGSINIAASRTIGDYIIPQMLYDFKVKYKNIDIHYETLNSKTIVEMIANAKIDLGFIESEIYNENLSMKKVGSDELIVVTKDKKLSDRKFYIDELQDRIWLLREEGSGTRDTFLETIGDLSKMLNDTMIFSSFESIKRVLLKNKSAITCISKICVDEELANALLYKVKLSNISFKRNFYMVHHKQKHINRIFEVFSKFSRDYFRDF